MESDFKLPLVGLPTCYYETLDMTDPLYLAGVTTCVVGALGRGDLKLFDRMVAPELVAKIRPIAPKFFANLLRFHNHFSGESRTTELSPREFYLAQQLVDGYSYKEIAAKLGVSIGRVNDLVRTVYKKLGVHGKTELAKLV